MGNTQEHPTYQYGFLREDKPATPGHSRELICVANKDHPDTVTPAEFNGCRTLDAGFRKTVETYPDERFLGTRNQNIEGKPYEWKTYKEVDHLAESFAKGMHLLDLIAEVHEPQVNQHLNTIGIFSKNREEWAIVDLAAMRSAVTIVPFFDSLGPAALSFVVNQTEISTMCAESAGIESLLKLKEKGDLQKLTAIVAFDTITAEQQAKADHTKVRLITYSAVIEEGKKHEGPMKFKETTPDTIYIICYTSGTTGDPKGSMMSHSYYVACAASVDYFQMNFTKDDVALSYLPYAHLFEQAFFVYTCFNGLKTGFYQGSPLLLFDDIETLKPTMLLSVPRILNRIYNKIFEDVGRKSGFVQWLFARGVASKQSYLETQGAFDHKFYDNLVFKAVRAKFGGNLRILVTGSAPISPEIISFFKVALSIHVYEAYGQTEGGPSTITLPQDPNNNHCGGPTSVTKIRVKDLPEMQYMSTDTPYPRGELQFKGSTMIKGYFKNPEKTAELFDEEGWINSGDVAMILDNGCIRLFDRAKNIFKLSQGEYIAPEKIENNYSQCGAVSQIFVYGDSLQSFLVAIIVPNMDFVKEWAGKHGKGDVDVKEIIQLEDFQKEVFDQMKRKETETHMSGLEKVKKVAFHSEAFSIQNDLLTPTFKLKRNVAKKLFEKEIQDMYKGAQL